MTYLEFGINGFMMKYKNARKMMQQGDLIAFSGTGLFSALIKSVTFSDISHVGVILQSQVLGTSERINHIIESTSLNDNFAGVQINRMSQRVEEYKGKIYWYALKWEFRERFNVLAFTEFLLAQNKKPYDKIQAAFSALDLIPESKEDFSKLFCSELVTAGYEAGGIIPPTNASEQTPKDVINFGIYEERVLITL